MNTKIFLHRMQLLRSLIIIFIVRLNFLFEEISIKNKIIISEKIFCMKNHIFFIWKIIIFIQKCTNFEHHNFPQKSRLKLMKLRKYCENCEYIFDDKTTKKLFFKNSLLTFLLFFFFGWIISFFSNNFQNRKNDVLLYLCQMIQISF